MAQRNINGEQYEAFLIRGDLNGGPVPVAFASGVTISGVTIGAEVEISNDSGNPVPTEPLGIPLVARQLAAGSTSANTVLTSGCTRISMKAIGADIRYAIGSSSQTASGTSHFIGNGERLDLAMPVTPNIAVLRNGSTDGTLELTELS